MFEKFTSADAADFRQRYLGTYGFFRKGERKTLVRLTSIETGNEKVVSFSTRGGEKCFLYPDSEDDTVGFEFIPPKRGYHNTPVGTFMLTRTPARQYLRGICDKNTAIKSVTGTVQIVGFDMLSALFEDSIAPRTRYEYVMNLPTSSIEELSFAISSQFAVSIGTRSVYCLGRPIGKVSLMPSPTNINGSLLIDLDDHDLWATEIKDALKRAGIEGVVK